MKNNIWKINYICIFLLQIRVTHKQWGDIIQFVEELREQSHLDAEYIFHKLCYLRAFSFVATGLEEVIDKQLKIFKYRI